MARQTVIPEEKKPLPPIDFPMALHFMARAKTALEAGNEPEFIAARKIVLVALGVDSGR